MKQILAVLSLLSLSACPFGGAAYAAEVDARPYNRLSLSASGSRQKDVDDGGAGSLGYLHYFTPNALLGASAEHQFIGDAEMTFGTLRGAFGRGEPSSRTTLSVEGSYGDGDDNGRPFDYSVYALGVTQAITSNLSLELEAREFDIDTTTGTLPKFGITYVWTPRLLTYISYARSFGGNLGTELTTGRIDYYGPVNLKLGAASGRANPAVLVLLPDVTLPATKSRQGYIGIGKTFKRFELLLVGDYLETGEAEKVTLTLSFTAFVGTRGAR